MIVASHMGEDLIATAAAFVAGGGSVLLTIGRARLGRLCDRLTRRR